MKCLVLYALCFVAAFQAHAQSADIELVRANYEKSVKDKTLCAAMLLQLESKKNEPLYQAYLGGFQTIWAKHVFNPFTKLKTFNNGKSNIETALLKDPNNWEIRLIRLSVQKNCPSFLGYHRQIDEDKQYIQPFAARSASPALKKMLDALL